MIVIIENYSCQTWHFNKRVFFRLFFPSQSSVRVSRGPGPPVDTHRGSPRRQHSGIQHHHCPPSPEWEPPAPFCSISAAFLLLRLCEAPHEHRSPGSDRGAVTLMSWPQEPSGRPPHGPVSSFHFPSSPAWTSVLSPALPKHATREVRAPCEPQWGNSIWCCVCLVGGRPGLQ